MKRIRTSKPVGSPRFIYTLIISALIVATLGMGSGIAADNNAKVTLVYEAPSAECAWQKPENCL